MKYIGGNIYTPDQHLAFADIRLVDALQQCGISCAVITEEDLVDEAFSAPIYNTAHDFPRRPTPEPTHALLKEDFKVALERLDAMQPPLKYVDYDGQPVTAGDLLFRAMIVSQRALIKEQQKRFDLLQQGWRQDRQTSIDPYVPDAA
jgi:hypothetical protein